MGTRRLLGGLVAAALVLPLGVPRPAAIAQVPSPAAPTELEIFGWDGMAAFDTGLGTGVVDDLLVDGSGRSIVVGVATPMRAVDSPWLPSELRVQRYGAVGRLDPAFGSSGGVVVPADVGSRTAAAALDAQGRLLVATGGSTVRLWRLSPAGALDATFGAGGGASSPSDGFTTAVAVVPRADGAALLVAGDGIHAFAGDGTPLASYGSGGHVVPDPPAAVLAAGGDASGAATLLVSAVQPTGVFAFELRRYLPDGRPDPSLDGDGAVVLPIGSGQAASVAPGSLALDEAGGVLLGADRRLYRVLADGSFDAAVGGAVGFATCDGTGLLDAQVAVRGDVVTVVGTGGEAVVSRFDLGGADPATPACSTAPLLIPNGGDPAIATPRGAPGALVVARAASATHRGAIDASVAVFDATGAPVTGFGVRGVAHANLGTGSSDVAEAAAADGSGRLLVAGSAGTDESLAAAGSFVVTRLLPDGRVDQAYGTAGGHRRPELGSAVGIVALADGSAVILASDAGRPVVLRLDAGGRPAVGFGTGGQAAVAGLTRGTEVEVVDGVVLVGGRDGTYDFDGDAVVAALDLTTGLPVPRFPGAATTASLSDALPVDGIAVLPDRVVVTARGLVRHATIGCWRRIDWQPCTDLAAGAGTVGGGDEWFSDVEPGPDGGMVGLSVVGRPIWADRRGVVLRRAEVSEVDFGRDGREVLAFVVARDGGTTTLRHGLPNEHIHLERHLADGSFDTAFGSGGRSTLGWGHRISIPRGALAALPDGHLVAVASGPDLTAYRFDPHPPPLATFHDGDAVVLAREVDGVVGFTVRLDRPAEVPAQVVVAVQSVPWDPVDPGDFAEVGALPRRLVTFAVGQQEAVARFAVRADGTDEGPEPFWVRLVQPVGVRTVDHDASATGEIADGAAGPSTPVGPPRQLTTGAGRGTVTVRWQPPFAAPPSANDLGYRIRLWRAGVLVSEQFRNSRQLATSFDGLIDGAVHHVEVSALTRGGAGIPSSVAEATPIATGSTPSAGSNIRDVVAAAGRRSLRVSWRDQLEPGGIPLLGYHVFAVDGRNGTVAGRATVGADTWSSSIAGLVDGVTYQVWVVGVSARGYESFGAAGGSPRASAPPATRPGAVPWQLAEPVGMGADRVRIRWGSVQNDGGAPVQGFLVATLVDGVAADLQSLPASARSTEVAAGIGGGRTAQVYVIAHNAAGLGDFDLARPITIAP